MATQFTFAGEFRRGKGQRKIRTGPRMRMDAMTQYRGTRMVQSPDLIAFRKLTRLLEKPGLSRADKIESLNKVRGAEQLRFMNMEVLSEVLLYMHHVGHVVDHDSFTYQQILPYIDKLLPRRDVIEGGVKTKVIPETDLEIYRLRLAATFLRYIRFVILYQQELTRRIEEAVERTGEQAMPEIEEF